MRFELTDQVTRHLAGDVVWLTTVSPSGRPAPRPVWFVFDGTAFLAFSQTGAAKVKHIDRNPNVTLHFNSTDTGGDVLVIVGRAARVAGKPSETPGYLDKYGSHLPGIGFTTDSFDAEYSVAIRIVPERMWGFD